MTAGIWAGFKRTTTTLNEQRTVNSGRQKTQSRPVRRRLNKLADESTRFLLLGPLNTVALHCSLSTVHCSLFTVTIKFTSAGNPDTYKLQRKRLHVDTTKIEDRQERKKLKRTARKKAAPKAKRTTPRGSSKQKVKKMVRGQSKR